MFRYPSQENLLYPDDTDCFHFNLFKACNYSSTYRRQHLPSYTLEKKYANLFHFSEGKLLSMYVTTIETPYDSGDKKVVQWKCNIFTKLRTFMSWMQLVARCQFYLWFDVTLRAIVNVCVRASSRRIRHISAICNKDTTWIPSFE